jgi:hypothetical protein
MVVPAHTDDFEATYSHFDELQIAKNEINKNLFLVSNSDFS